jgi:hypothetical protein
LKAVLEQYEAVVDLESFRDMAHSKVAETAVKANGLLNKFQKGNTYLLLCNVRSFKSIFNDAVTAAVQLNLDRPSVRTSKAAYISHQKGIAAWPMLMLPHLLKILIVEYFFSFLTWLSHSYQSDSIETRLRGSIDTNKKLIRSYPELKAKTLSTQLSLFRHQMKYTNVQEAVEVMQSSRGCSQVIHSGGAANALTSDLSSDLL